MEKYEEQYQKNIQNKIRWVPDFLENVSYHVSVGNYKPVQEYLAEQNKKQVPKFFGYCYYCSAPMHSQNYCPARQCRKCLQYGHSTKICPLFYSKSLPPSSSLPLSLSSPVSMSGLPSSRLSSSGSSFSSGSSLSGS